MYVELVVLLMSQKPYVPETLPQHCMLLVQACVVVPAGMQALHVPSTQNEPDGHW